MFKEFELLAKKIKKECHSNTIYYLPNPGNWGDALIRYATLSFLNDNSIPFSELRLTRKIDWIKPLFKRGILVYGGGGAWCKNWNHAYNILLKKKFLFSKLIVLPSTFELKYDLPNTIFFRRDQYGSKINMPESLFCHDMVFYLKNKIKPSQKANKQIGNFFRVDHEGLKNQIPDNNIDITHDKNVYDPIEPFIEILSMYEIINTDKLHIAILGSLLNKKVNFYSGNYFKNKAVYLSSIKNNFPETRFFE